MGNTVNLAVLTNYHLEKMGGAEEALDRLARLWQAAGHRVTLFASPPRRGSNYHVRPWQPAYDLVHIPRPFSTRFGLFRYFTYLEKVHRVRPFDLVFACDSYWAGHVAGQFAVRNQVPFVVCSQGSDVMDGSRFARRWPTRGRMIQALRRADGVVAISRYMEKQMRELADPPGVRRILANGWPDEWDSVPAPPRPTPHDYLFSMGRLIELKGFHILVQAYARIRANHPRLGLVIAGDGPYRGNLARLAQSLGIPVVEGEAMPQTAPPWLWLPGFIHGDKKLAVLRNALAGISPSIRQEPMSLVVFEMLAGGVPVVGSNVGGTPDIVLPGTNGTLFKPADPADLARCLDELIGTPGLRDKLAANAAASVAPYRWSHVARRYLDLFEEVVRRRKQAA